MTKPISTAVSLTILLSGAVAQTGAKLPEFDVVNIQASQDASQPMVQWLPGGKTQFQAVPMRFLVLAAWGYENQVGRLTGGPSWIDSEKFDLQAEAPPASSVPTLRLMLKAFLIKRFGLEAHIEDKVTPVYGLTKGTGGLKMKPSATTGASECTRSNQNNETIETCRNMTMDDLADGLHSMAPVYIDKPVVNLTEIKGAYDFELRWTPRAQLSMVDEMTVFDSVDKQLGLTLKPAEHAIPMIAIDKLSRMETPK